MMEQPSPWTALRSKFPTAWPNPGSMLLTCAGPRRGCCAQVPSSGSCPGAVIPRPPTTSSARTAERSRVVMVRNDLDGVLAFFRSVALQSEEPFTAETEWEERDMFNALKFVLVGVLANCGGYDCYTKAQGPFVAPCAARSTVTDCIDLRALARCSQ